LLAYVLYKFFAEGSRPARYLPPILIPSAAESELDIRFTPPLAQDYKLMYDLTGFQLKRNAPNLVRMGISSTRTGIEQRLGAADLGEGSEFDSTEKDFNNILDFPVPVDLTTETLLFRVRIAPKRPSNPSEYDSPPSDLAIANRLNPQAVRVFYGAFDVETCAFEMKPSMEDIVNERMHVATFRSTRTLRLFDLVRYPFDMDGPDGPGAVYYFIRSLFSPRDHDYKISQQLATRIAARGFDGILYPSAYSYIRNANAYPNIVLFGAPLASGQLQLLSINKMSFQAVSFACNLGPVLMDDD